MTRHSYYFIFMALFTVGQIHCGGGGSGTASPEAQGSVGETVASITIPHLKLPLSSADVLFLDDQTENGNLNKIQEDQVQPAFEVEGESAETDLSADRLPKLSDFVMGPNGELAGVLEVTIRMGNDYCNLIYVPSDSSAVLCANFTEKTLIGLPQFDFLGNLYFSVSHTQTDEAEINKFDPVTGETTNIINDKINIFSWRLHPAGVVFLKGSNVSNRQDFFRVINQDGSVENIFDADVYVDNFWVVDNNHLLILADHFFVYTVAGEKKGLLEQFGSSSYYFVSRLQRSASGKIYGLDNEEIKQIYPGIPRVIDMDMDSIAEFKVIGETIYAIGTRDTKPVLMKKNINDGIPAKNLLGDFEIDVYHFDLLNEYLFFDGLDFKTNTVILARFNLNTNDLVILDEPEEKLAEIKTNLPNYSATYSDVDDLRDIFLDFFDVSEASVIQFSEYNGDLKDLNDLYVQFNAGQTYIFAVTNDYYQYGQVEDGNGVNVFSEGEVYDDLDDVTYQSGQLYFPVSHNEVSNLDISEFDSVSRTLIKSGCSAERSFNLDGMILHSCFFRDLDGVDVSDLDNQVDVPLQYYVDDPTQLVAMQDNIYVVDSAYDAQRGVLYVLGNDDDELGYEKLMIFTVNTGTVGVFKRESVTTVSYSQRLRLNDTDLILVGHNGFSLVDVSDITAPDIRFKTAVQLNQIQDVAVTSDFVFVGTQDNGHQDSDIVVFDMTNPENVVIKQIQPIVGDLNSLFVSKDGESYDVYIGSSHGQVVKHHFIKERE